MARSAALRRYDEACARYHQAAFDVFEDEITAAWEVLPLRTRLRVMLALPWRDALHEVRAHFSNGGRPERSTT
jgi:hypothetical protein